MTNPITKILPNLEGYEDLFPDWKKGDWVGVGRSSKTKTKDYKSRPNRTVMLIKNQTTNQLLLKTDVLSVTQDYNSDFVDATTMGNFKSTFLHTRSHIDIKVEVPIIPIHIENIDLTLEFIMEDGAVMTVDDCRLHEVHNEYDCRQLGISVMFFRSAR